MEGAIHSETGSVLNVTIISVFLEEEKNDFLHAISTMPCTLSELLIGNLAMVPP